MNGVELLACHPNLPRCENCQKYQINYSWLDGTGDGEVKTYQSGPNEWSPLERTKDNPPPCDRCPKKGPQHEHEFLLSERSLKTLEFYRQTKATFGKGLTEEQANDAVVRRHFAILDRIYKAKEREQLGEEVAGSVAQLFARVGK